MKQIFTLLVLIVMGFAASAQKEAHSPAQAPAPKEALELKEITYDFGKILQGRPVTHSFELKNTGKKPLLIENVQVSCGCTTPEWSEAPIAPGATTTVKIGFNAASEGKFSKNIAIIYNNHQAKNLTITGEVLPMPATSAPLNTSLSLIK